MKRFIILLLMLTNSLLAYNISGIVFDKATDESIIGVNIMLGQNNGTSTDNNGFFIIRNIKPGQHKILLSHIAYKTKTINIEIDGDIYLNKIELIPKIIENEAIEIFGKKKSLVDNDLDISSFQANSEILTNAPQLNKDVFKLMQFSPSVSISDPLSPLFHVRGSDPGENLVQLDGMTIYNPQHFMASEAIFNPYAIKNIEMLVGGFSAEYGGRNASILNIVSRDGNKNKVQGEFKPSTSGISGAIDIPINTYSSTMLSCRIKTDLLTDILMNSPNIMSDIIGKYNTKIGDTKLSLTGFYGQDYQNFDISAFTIFFPELGSFEEGYITNTQNYAFGVKSNSVLHPCLLFDSHIYFSRSDIDNETYLSFAEEDTKIDYSTYINNKISDFTYKSNLTYYAFGNQTIKVGLELNYLDFVNKIGEFAEDINNRDANIQAFYIDDKWEIKNLSLKLGVRNTRTLENNNWQLEPRFSAAYKFGVSTFKLNWGQYNQYITTLDMQGDEFVKTLQYFQSLKEYRPVAAEKISFGLDTYINEEISFSLTGYYKDLYRLYNLNYSITGDETVEKGYGWAYGFEALIRGKYNRMSGWMAYTYSRGFRKFSFYNNGKSFPYDGDQPHNFKALLFYKLNKDITTSMTFILSSGYPKTWETGKYSQFSYDPVTNEIGGFPRDITPIKNNVRYPSRISLELGWKKLLRTGFGKYLADFLGAKRSYYTVSIKNILFLKRNPYYYLYLDSDFGYYAFDPYIFPFPIISTGYIIKF